MLFSQLHNMDYNQLLIEFNVRAARQTCLSSELSLKEAEVAKAVHLHGQVTTVEAAEVSRTNELNGLKEQKSSLEEEKSVLKSKVVALESVDATKVTELASLTAQTAKLTQDLSELGLSCDELSVKASSLEAERDRLVSQMSLLEGTCFELHDEVSGYRLFKEQIDVVQDEQVKVISDKVAGLDAELIGMALHLDEEFYPHFFTTIAGQRWILGHGLRLVVVKSVSQKDASIADILGLLHLDGLADETLEADQLQPFPEQLMLPIHRIQGDAASQRLSISDAMVPLIELLFAENLVGEDCTSGGPVVVSTTTALSTTFVEVSSVPPIPVSDYEVADTEAQARTSFSHKIIFEEETLETSPENPAT
ncbi:hypothetical protein Tco_1502888 [Tanacetum coccineum]